MNQSPLEFTRVLAVDPASRGLGFAVLEEPDVLIDWGFRETRTDRNARCLAHLISMITKFKPDVLVVEDFGTQTRRPARVRELVDALESAANEAGLPCRRISRKCVRAKFPACRTKYDVARELANRFSEIKPWCPPTRKIWLTEDPRINIFDALSLAVTHLSDAEGGHQAPSNLGS